MYKVCIPCKKRKVALYKFTSPYKYNDNDNDNVNDNKVRLVRQAHQLYLELFLLVIVIKRLVENTSKKSVVFVKG